MAAEPAIDAATLQLLERWRREDATNDPDEIRAAEQDLSNFKKCMNDNRASSGDHFPFK